MYDPIEVAWKVLFEAKAQGKSLSNLQLQKLVYISHGYLLGWQNRALINKTIEAWTYGPVISPIYQEFKEYKDNKIYIYQMFPTALDQDSEATECIRSVLGMYGNMDAMDLVNITHQPNTPWHEIWHNQNGSQYYGAPISNELIRNHYRKVIATPQEVHGL